MRTQKVLEGPAEILGLDQRMDGCLESLIPEGYTGSGILPIVLNRTQLTERLLGGK